MSSPNIFADDWRACLHAHYLHVLHERDTSNEASLRLILTQVGLDVNALDDVRTAEMQLEASGAALEAVEPAAGGAGPRNDRRGSDIGGGHS